MLDLRQFLDHLAWYWVIARYSQALKVQEDRNEKELRPITVTKAEELLRRLYELQEKVAAEDTAAVRYFPRLAAMRITRAEFSLTLGRKFGDDDFSNLFSGKGRPFFDRVREFVHEPTYEQWRNRRLQGVRETAPLRTFLAPWLPDELPTFFHTLLQWNEQRGVTWFAFRDLSPEMARRFPDWTPDRCGKELQNSPRPTNIEVFTSEATRSWVGDIASAVHGLIDASDDVVQRLALASLEERAWHQTDAADGIPILDTTPPTFLVTYRTQSPAPFDANLVTAINAAAECADSRGLETYDIALATTANSAIVMEMLPRLVDASPGLRTCYVIDADALLSVAGRRPELWTVTANGTLGFAAITERRSLQRVLGLEEGDIENAPRHPAIMSAETSGATVLRIVGKAGSGKSTVLYHLASAHIESALILVATLGRNARVLEQFVRTSSRPVIVLLDDLERQIAIPTAAWEVASLLAAARAAEQPVRVLISCLSSERESVQRVIGSVLVRSRVAELDLDNIARPEAEEFLGEIIRRTTRAYGLELSAGEILTHARTWTVDGGTPREVVRRIAELATGSPQPLGTDYWHSRFVALLREGRIVETQVLQVLALLRAAEAAAMPRSLVQQLVTAAFERSVTEFENALAVLINDGWIRSWRDELYADTVQLDRKLTYLLRQGEPSSAYRQLVHWITLNLSSVAFEYRDWLRRHAAACLQAWGEHAQVASLHDHWQAEAEQFIATNAEDRLRSEADITLWRLFVRSLGNGEMGWAEQLIAQWPLANEDPVILQGILEECGMNGWFDEAQRFLDWLFFERPPATVISLLEYMVLHDGTETIIDDVARELRRRGQSSNDLDTRIAAVEAMLRDDDPLVLPDLVTIAENAVSRGALAFAKHLVENIPETSLTTPERRRMASLRQIVRDSGTSIPTARQLFERLHPSG